jgi:hypothetical protein
MRYDVSHLMYSTDLVAPVCLTVPSQQERTKAVLFVSSSKVSLTLNLPFLLFIITTITKIHILEYLHSPIVQSLSQTKL